MHAPPPAPGTREKRLSRRFLSGTIHYKNGTFHMFYCSTGNKKYRLIPQSAHKSATCFHAKSTASCLPCEPLPARRPFAGRPDALSMQNKNQRIRHIHEPDRPQTVRCHAHKQTRGLRTKAACRTRATSQPLPIFAWPAPLPPAVRGGCQNRLRRARIAATFAGRVYMRARDAWPRHSGKPSERRHAHVRSLAGRVNRTSLRIVPANCFSRSPDRHQRSDHRES